MKITLRRVLIFLLLIALSIGFGFAWDATATAIERHRYPLQEEFSLKISQYAEQYGIPEPVLWAVVRNNSQFASKIITKNKLFVKVGYEFTTNYVENPQSGRPV